MGIIGVTDAFDAPFPRRLLRALADYAVSCGQPLAIWERILLRFDVGGAFLDLLEISEEERSAFKLGLVDLNYYLKGRSSFASYDSSELQALINGILSEL